MSKEFKWTMPDRQILSGFLMEGYAIKNIEEAAGYSRFNIVKELKRGLTEEEYKEGRYIKYNPKAAVYQTALQAIGEDGMKVLLEEYGVKK